MKLLFALTIVAAAVGAGLLSSGQPLPGLALLLPGVVLGVVAVVRMARRWREALRSTRRSPVADDPAVARSFRRTAVAVFLLAALPTAAALGLVYAFATLALDPSIDPALRSATVVLALLLTGIPVVLAISLAVNGVLLLRGDPRGGESAFSLAMIMGGLAALAVVGALVENRPATEIAYSRPGVLLFGGVTVVVCIVALVMTSMLTTGVKEAEERPAPPGRTAY